MGQQVIDMDLLVHYKDLYSGHKILYVRFLDNDFIFRSLTRKEYKYLITQGLPPLDLEDRICNLACIYPEDYDFNYCGYAGLNEYVADVIRQISGFKDVRDIMSDYYKYKNISNMETQCMDLIKAFIPEYTYEEMEDWTWGKLMQMTVRAENVAQLKGFDWSLKDETEEYMSGLESMTPDNKEFVEQLEKDGVDPMFYFENELKDSFKKDVVDFPLIGGTHWDDEVILGVIRKQLKEKTIT